MIKYVIFDVYGTLISTGTGSVDAASKILSKLGRTDIPAREFYSYWKKYHKKLTYETAEFHTEASIFLAGLRQLYADYNIDGNPDEDVEIMLESLVGRKPFDESEDVINTLNTMLPVFIGSNTDTEPLMMNLRESTMKFDRIFTSESLRAYKPHKDFFIKIINELNIKPEHTLFVGDSLIDDIYGPKQVGMQTCWVNRKIETSADIKPDFEIHDLSALIGIIKEHGEVK